MKALSIVALILAFLQVSQTPMGIIEGVVTRKDGTTGLSGIRIEIEEGFPSARLGRPFGAETTTDRGGRFTVRDVPAGEFEVTARLEGYLGRAHAKVVMSPGQRRQIALELTPGATIRGRVTDSGDHPVSSVSVRILQQYTDEVGQRRWTYPSVDRDRAETNAVGEYRIPLVAPGVYYVRTTRDADADRDFVYFPGTEEPTAAAAISVGEGAEVIADIRIPPTVESARFRVSGKLARSSTIDLQRDPSREFPGITLIPRDRALLDDNWISGDVDKMTGRFEIGAVLPGAYDLLATILVGQERYTAKVPINIRGHDVEDVSLVVSPGVEVKAHIVVDGDPQDFLFSRFDSNGDKRRSVANIAVALKGKEIPYPNRAVVDESGNEISFRNVPEGTYEVSVSIQPGSGPLNPDFFVEDVRVAGRSVYDNGLRVGLDPVDSVEIVIGRKGGSIEVTIPQKEKTAAIAILIPDSFRRNNPALYRREVLPASSERVLLRGIAPGNYRIFAVPDTGESLPFRSPEFAARYESRAVTVTVQKGATVGPIQVPLLRLER